ncbi:hypothetical protein ACVW19_005818 [Streptomyces sp. TE5632]
MWDELEVSGTASAHGSATGASPKGRTANGLRHGPGRNPRARAAGRRQIAGPDRRRVAAVPEGLTQSSRASASTGFGIMKDVAKAAARMTTPAIMAAV